MAIVVREAECHPETCLDIEGPNGHVANVNPIGFTDDQWRIDCDHCFTCIRTGLTKREAVAIAKVHVLLTREEYQKLYHNLV